MNIRSPVTGLVMLAFAGMAQAGLAVTYNFTAFSSYPVGGIDSVAGSFIHTSDHYYTAAQSWVSPGGLSGCSVVAATCGNMGFAANAWNKDQWDRLDFGIRNTPDGSSLTVNYYFALGAFSAVGVYDSIQLGPAQAARLVVTMAELPDAVPQPEIPRACIDTPFGGPPPAWCGGIPYGGEASPAGGGGAGSGNGMGPPTSYPIPEPETYSMMLAGLGLLGLTARRRRQKLNR